MPIEAKPSPGVGVGFPASPFGYAVAGQPALRTSRIEGTAVPAYAHAGAEAPYVLSGRTGTLAATKIS